MTSLPKINLAFHPLLDDNAPLLVLPVYEDEINLKPKQKYHGRLKGLDELIGGNLLELIALENFKAKLASTIMLYLPQRKDLKRVILLGMGSKEALKDLNLLRKAVASAIRKVVSLKAEKIALALPGEGSSLELEMSLRATAEVSLLAGYKFDKYQSKKPDDKYEGLKEFTLLFPDSLKKEQAKLKAVIEKAQAGAEGVRLARELISDSPNIVNPAYLAETAQRTVKAQKDARLTLKILGKKDCEKLKMGAFLAVAQGSANEPRFLHYHFSPKGKPKKHIAIVGKGITFDSGGLSLKPAKAMEKMKYDMAGSAAVIGLMSVITKIDPKVEVSAYVAACENMPSGTAYRPGDVITAMSGKTIEINNTDAEGRVTLADAVYYATKQKPDQIIDIATLTGAIVVALGEAAAGLMSNNPAMAEAVKEAFDEAGEKVWEMPLYEDYEEDVTKNTIADLLNAGSGGQAGSQNGALFIKHFVEGIPWVHLDIAGTCWPEKRDTWYTSRNSAAGFGVLGFIRYLENLSGS
ncbi:MAG: leucyl aminopeptidase [Candidatus Caenarcaniphilales bacterium]|nr:leucyl aminopeptidase [Candidatus Caenarcaniphilales bacterium]